MSVLRHFQISPWRFVRAWRAVDVKADAFFSREVRRGGFQCFEALRAFRFRRCCPN